MYGAFSLSVIDLPTGGLLRLHCPCVFIAPSEVWLFRCSHTDAGVMPRGRAGSVHDCSGGHIQSIHTLFDTNGDGVISPLRVCSYLDTGRGGLHAVGRGAGDQPLE